MTMFDALTHETMTEQPAAAHNAHEDVIVVAVPGGGREAIEMYAAAERTIDQLDGGTWVAFAKMVYGRQSFGDTADSIGEYLKTEEKAYQEANQQAPIPNTYRSAKSVALNAVRKGVSLVDEAGNILGKSAVQKALKAKKDAETDAMNAADEGDSGDAAPKDYVGAYLRASQNLGRKMGFSKLTAEQQDQIRAAIDALCNS
jgi:hypothetical protein